MREIGSNCNARIASGEGLSRKAGGRVASCGWSSSSLRTRRVNRTRPYFFPGPIIDSVRTQLADRLRRRLDRGLTGFFPIPCERNQRVN
jgi:hypothetical protein